MHFGARDTLEETKHLRSHFDKIPVHILKKPPLYATRVIVTEDVVVDRYRAI
jgi:hypothetical protein